MSLLTQRGVALAAVAGALLVATVATVQLSDTALVVPAAASAWRHDALVVGDEPTAAGLFDVTGMMPREPIVRCQTVGYGGTHQAADVRLYATDLAGPLVPYLDVRVELGGRCEDFLGHTVLYDGPLRALPGRWEDAASAWIASGSAQRAYRVSVTMRDDVRAQGQRASATIVWEARPAVR